MQRGRSLATGLDTWKAVRSCQWKFSLEAEWPLPGVAWKVLWAELSSLKDTVKSYPQYLNMALLGNRVVAGVIS